METKHNLRYILHFSITNTNVVPYLSSSIGFQNSTVTHHTGHIWSPVEPQKDQLVESSHIGSTVSMHHSLFPRTYHPHISHCHTFSCACPVGFHYIVTGHSHIKSRSQQTTGKEAEYGGRLYLHTTKPRFVDLD